MISSLGIGEGKYPVGPGEGRSVRDVLLDQFALRQPKLQPNLSANVIEKIEGRYTVKVFNDNADVPMDFAVNLVVSPPDKR